MGLDSARNVVIVILLLWNIQSQVTYLQDTNKRNNGTIIFSWTPTFP